MQLIKSRVYVTRMGDRGVGCRGLIWLSTRTRGRHLWIR